MFRKFILSAAVICAAHAFSAGTADAVATAPACRDGYSLRHIGSMTLCCTEDGMTCESPGSPQYGQFGCRPGQTRTGYRVEHRQIGTCQGYDCNGTDTSIPLYGTAAVFSLYRCVGTESGNGYWSSVCSNFINHDQTCQQTMAPCEGGCAAEELIPAVGGSEIWGLNGCDELRRTEPNLPAVPTPRPIPPDDFNLLSVQDVVSQVLSPGDRSKSHAVSAAEGEAAAGDIVNRCHGGVVIN